jgi:prevent-host-death family protein
MRKELHDLPLSEARVTFRAVLNRVEYPGDWFRFTKKGKAIAVLMPLRDCEELLRASSNVEGGGPGDGVERREESTENASDARDKLSEILRAVHEKRIWYRLTKYGKEVAMLLPHVDYKTLVHG